MVLEMQMQLKTMNEATLHFRAEDAKRRTMHNNSGTVRRPLYGAIDRNLADGNGTGGQSALILLCGESILDSGQAVPPLPRDPLQPVIARLPKYQDCDLVLQ
ncbi:hypothetical protein NDU88_000944 [Pleurodeles waltl]|uniref:Uncharacterized protein n=1 Tax=Pleurodeles waltl TaxID=8319 RepID=A0AAV7M3V5_PLEWA|nr:hypothetical protein NDU88_000944 [Pleurodeles waltl]